MLGPIILDIFITWFCDLTDEIEEELAPLIEAQEVKHIETYEEQLQKTKEAANDLSWIQFLGTVLKTVCKYKKLLLFETII